MLLHISPTLQVPQLPPMPFGPHSFTPHEPDATQVPAAVQSSSTFVQTPQLPPAPSGPQTRPAHGSAPGMQVPAEVHDCPAGQVPHGLPQPSSPHAFPLQVGTHAHVPAALQA